MNCTQLGYARTPMVEKMALESNPEDPESAIRDIAVGVPMKRLAKPTEVGELFAFLGSDESATSPAASSSSTAAAPCRNHEHGHQLIFFQVLRQGTGSPPVPFFLSLREIRAILFLKYDVRGDKYDRCFNPNLYGDLFTELYERLHPTAPEDELAFFLSYAQPDSRILEPLCGSGRFLLPFLQRGFSIYGVDLSEPMLGGSGKRLRTPV